MPLRAGVRARVSSSCLMRSAAFSLSLVTPQAYARMSSRTVLLSTPNRPDIARQSTEQHSLKAITRNTGLADTTMLYEFIERNREEIIRRCRAKVSVRSAPSPTEAEIDRGIPLFLDQLANALRLRLPSSQEMANSAVTHGGDLLRQGFTVSQVVHDYGDVCQSITELALETNAPISTDDFRMLNGCLDNAIAGAVTEYGDRKSVV